MWKVESALCAGLAGIAFLCAEAVAHGPDGSWSYPPACCRGDAFGGDCERIPKESVREGRMGYIVTLRPGDHHRVSRPHRFTVPYGSVIRSGDGNFHACLHPTEGNLNCFFAPEGQS
jgi:hypothetical protein